MIEKSMIEAIRRDFDGCAKVRIYVLKAGDHVLYVGQTRDSIAGRIGRHLSPGQWMYDYVKSCAPNSWKWHFELYSHEEAAAMAELSEKSDLDTVEARLVGMLRPSVNKTYNARPRPLPEEIATRIVDLETTIGDFVPV
jgi:predicted GIY-YIG superfamily endonuclease